MHTARWRHDVELAGKRVAVIGTGASAVQVVPALVQRVARMYVCQRTPSWVLPRPDLAIPPWLQRGFETLPGLRLALRGAIFLWLEAISLGLRKPALAFWARALSRHHLRRQIGDPALRTRLQADFPIGCKRVLISSDFYPALAQPHCTLEDTPIERIEPSGIRLRDGRLLEVDVIVHATGFRPLDVLRDLEIVGRDGRRLAEDWSDRPRAYLGIGVHGFPNLSLLLGPNTALGHNSVLTMIESQVHHVLTLMRHARNHGARSVEPTAEAQAAFIEMLDRRFVGTAWAGGCHSWYLDAQGRNIALWVGSAMAYRRLTRRVRVQDYQWC
jgi:cation diffusion facilitator CzcD-associated flavoprotein CzcO